MGVFAFVSGDDPAFEGIDLPGTRLVGAFIATLGLPQVNEINEAMKERMAAIFGDGWRYTYLYPGLQKVVQAAGRVIRGPEDRGVVQLIDDRFARKAIEKGADGLIPVAAGAGGHAGRQSPFALVQEIREWFDGPVALSGAIGHGRSILAAQACGADLAYIGSAFIATAEANAEEGYKNGIVEGRAADIVYSNLFTGVHGNYLRQSIVSAGMDPDNLPEGDFKTMNFGSGNEGGSKAKAWRDIWGSGQGIGAVDAVESVADRVDRLEAQYRAARARLKV